MEGVITTDPDTGVQTLDVPSPESISPVEKLKSDPEFVSRYLDGDKAAMAEMTSARHAEQEQIDAPAEQEYQGAGIPLDFGGIAKHLSIDEMRETQLEAADYMNRYGFTKEDTQFLFSRIVENTKQSIDNLEPEEVRRDRVHQSLRNQWGNSFDANFSKLIQTLEADPALDELLADSGAWADASFLARLVDLRRT